MTIHTIHFMRGINPDTLAGLQNVTLSAIGQGATEIHIHLSSEGGTNDHGFAIYHFLRSVKVPLTMKCIGNVESMALIMFLAADKRIIVPHGKVKIHPMHWRFSEGAVDHDRLSEFVDSLDFDAKRYAEIFDCRIGKNNSKSINVREHLAGKARLLTASEALEVGIATEISEVKIPEKSVVWWV
jgi:ATP-dependent Clp protease, protease subunit